MRVELPLSDSVRGPFGNDIPSTSWQGIHAGTMKTTYRGRSLLKSPFDLALYLKLIQELKPRTVIEIGVWEAGSTIWLADQLRSVGIEARVIGVDVALPDPVEDPTVTLIQGDALDLGDSLSAPFLDSLERPWLVIEDSTHTYETCTATLSFFADKLDSGDYIVVEDGIVDALGPMFQYLDSGPNRAVADFLEKHSDAFEVDVELCDFYGKNVTYNPNAWLRKT